ncbi:MAG: hypothetical protein IJN32_07560 [Thermoguttaceae bacterium]|nr:hypothetical protein [Thermoguttaceae bacterium]
MLTILTAVAVDGKGGVMSLKTNKLRQVLFGAALGVATLGVCAVPQVGAQDAKAEKAAKKASILVEKGLLKNPEAMLRTKFLAEIDKARDAWIAEYEKVETPADVEAYQKKKRDYFLNALGPMWERTPLNPQITGRLTKEKFRVENVIFESQPGVYVTGALFLPLEERFKGPYPAMLISCGHSTNGKAYDLYQSLGILAAVNGLAAFVVDPIDQGERFQHLNKAGKPTSVGIQAHNLVGAGATLVGRNCATFEVWDLMRAVDYLQTRDDIIPDKIGACGTSGGGTQTAYLMSLEDRIALACPSCYICSIYDDLTHNLGPQDAEQNIFGQAAFGLDHADYLFLRAPIPTLMCCVTDDFFNATDGWRSYRYAKRIFSRIGCSERLSIVEQDSPHSYGEHLRVATIRWALRWLAGRDEAITQHDQPLLTDEELNSVKSGKGIMSLPNARTSHDLTRDLAGDYAAPRRERWAAITAEEASQIVAKRAVIRTGEAAPSAKVVASEGADVVFETDADIYLTAKTNFAADEKFDALTLVISDVGRTSEPTNALFAAAEKAGNAEKIAAVELRGYGETQAKGRDYYRYSDFGTDGSDFCLAYLLGKSYVGLRVDDLLAVAKHYRETTGAKIALKAEGLAGTVALCAAVVEPEAFASVELVGDLPTWTAQLEAAPTKIVMTNTVFGVLKDFDIDDLRLYLEKRGTLK